MYTESLQLFGFVQVIKQISSSLSSSLCYGYWALYDFNRLLIQKVVIRVVGTYYILYYVWCYEYNVR